MQPPPLLIIKRPDASAIELEWSRPVLTIGRLSSNDIIIDHPLCSRHHARLEQEDETFFIHDLGSTNGTLINESLVAGRVPLHNGDQIQIADTVILFRDPEATMQGPLPVEVIRRARAEELRVDSRAKEVYVRGRLLDPPLTVKEFQLLELLYTNRANVISKDEIARAVWDYEVFDYNAIDALIYRLRQRVEPEPNNPRYIITVRGFGYKLVTTPES